LLPDDVEEVVLDVPFGHSLEGDAFVEGGELLGGFFVGLDSLRTPFGDPQVTFEVVPGELVAAVHAPEGTTPAERIRWL
jgi:hypothetical protein